MHENRNILCSFRYNFNPLCLALHAGGETCLISVDVVEYLGNKIIPTTWSQHLPSLGNVFGRREKALCIEICFYVDIEYNIQSNVWNWKKNYQTTVHVFPSIQVPCCILYPYKCLRKTNFKTQWRGRREWRRLGAEGLDHQWFFIHLITVHVFPSIEVSCRFYVVILWGAQGHDQCLPL